MAPSKTTERDEQYELTRRALIKWSLATGAALGVSRAKIAEVLEQAGGSKLAYAATELAACRSIHVAAGVGGFAWFNLLWPHNAVAAANNGNFSYHRPGQTQLVQGTDKPLTIGPDTPWATLPANKQVTAFTCGANATHNNNTNGGAALNGNSIYAIATVLQASNPSVLPAVALGGANQYFGTAPGGVAPAAAGDADGFVGLFNSAASQANGILANSANAALYKAQYDALVGLNRAANRTTTTAAYRTAKGAAQFLGTNLAAKLAITPEDRARYGIGGGTRANVAAIGNAFIVAVKAFKMGLTNNILLPAMRDDPHGAFANGDTNTIPAQLKAVFDGLMNDLKATSDDITGRSLDNDTVITVHGDTPKDPFNRGGWPDGTPRGSNWAYVYSAGHLKSGWFGGATAGGDVEGFDGAGNTTPGAYNANDTARMANASIAYAIAKRDFVAINNLAGGVTVSGVFGRPKDT